MATSGQLAALKGLARQLVAVLEAIDASGDVEGTTHDLVGVAVDLAGRLLAILAMMTAPPKKGTRP